MRSRSGCGRRQRRCRRYLNIRGLARVRTGERNLDRGGGGTTGDVATATIGGTQYAYYAGYGQNVVRRINLTTDEEQVVAGNGGFGAAVSGSPATATTVGPAASIAVDANGDMAILGEDQAVWFVPVSSGTYFGVSMTGGDIYKLSIAAEALALNPQGNLAYSYDGNIGVLSIASGTTTAITSTGSINNQAVAIDSAGDVAFVGSPSGTTFPNSNSLDEISFIPASTGGTYSGASASGDYFGDSMPIAGHAYALVDNCEDDNCTNNPGNDGNAYYATVSAPSSLTFDVQGDLTIGESGDFGVRFVPASNGTYFNQTMFAGYIYGIAGQGTNPITDGATATSVALVPDGVGIDSNGDLVAQAGLNGVTLVSKASDDIEVIAGNGSYGYDGEGVEGATAQFGEVSWVTSDANGDVAIVDGPDSRIRFIPAVTGEYFGQTMTGGDIYTIAGNGIPAAVASQKGGGGDGGLATAPAAQFSTFQAGSGIALDARGDLVIADPGTTFPLANQIRFVPARTGSYYGKAMLAGYVYEIGGASELSDPTDVAVDAAGNVFVADNGHDDVKEIAAGTGTLSTVVPSGATPEPYGIAVDAHGDIAVSNHFDSVNFIPNSTKSFFGQSMTAGTVYKIAGNGSEGYKGDGSSASSAELAAPDGLTFDTAGDLIIAQEGNGAVYHEDAVRFLPASSGTFYGQPMTVGDIYTIAGNGTQAFLGDGGPGTEAELAVPTAVAMMPGEDILIADSYDNRVRVLSGSVPIAKTGAAGSAGATSDTVEGSVNPQGRPTGYSFEYGTTTTYGASTPDSEVGSDHTEHPESQTLESLIPSTTYHYRIVAEYDEAGATISVPGADATFTTAAAASTGGNSGSPTGTTTTASTSTTSNTSTSTSSTVASVSVATSPKAIEELLNGCSGSPLVLNDAYIQGSHVFLSGSAAKSLVGKKVKILFNEGKPVATATVKANGQYTTTAPLPPAKIRDSLTTRYTAEIGKVRSVHLKLVRRLLLEPPKASGTTITLTGQLTPPLTKPIAPVTVEQQLECGKATVAKTFTPAANGHFHITLTVPANAKAAIFRLTSKVAANKHSVTHGFTTFSLPLPVALG